MAKRTKKGGLFTTYFALANSSPKAPHEIHFATKIDGTREEVTSHLASVLPDFYSSQKTVADRLKVLGYPNAAKIYEMKFPSAIRIKSGDLGEIIAHEYVGEILKLHIPVKKLRFKDSRDMAMRGEDLIAFIFANEKLKKIFKCEVKSRSKISKSVVKTIDQALSRNKGLPTAHAILFIADMAREQGNKKLAETLEFMLLKKGISASVVEHIGFVFSGNDSEIALNDSISKYRGKFKRLYIGVKVNDHTEFVKSVYKKAVK